MTTINRDGLGAMIALVVVLTACQESVTLAEKQSTADGIELDLPVMSVCDVIPMNDTNNKAISAMSDGSVVVGGYLNNENTVFGPGEVNETVISVDSSGLNPGFIAKYHADNTLAWVVGGFPPVTQLNADVDGGTIAVTDRYTEGDAENMQIKKWDTNGQVVWALNVRDGEKAVLNGSGDIFVTGSFSETVTLGEGDNVVTFENTDDTVAYVSYVAAYNVNRVLMWAVTLDHLYLTNDIAVGDNAIAVVDNSGTLVYLNSATGEELWRRKVGDSAEVDADQMMIAGSFVDFGTTRVSLASDGSVLWFGEFEISVIFSDEGDNVVALTTPHNFTENGGWSKVHPFVAHYTASGGLLSATDNIGFSTQVVDGKLFTINPTKNSDPEAPLFSSVLECSDNRMSCSNFVLAQMDLDGTVAYAFEAVLGVEVDRQNIFALEPDRSLWTTSKLVDGLGGGSYPSSNPGDPIVGNALVHLCPADE